MQNYEGARKRSLLLLKGVMPMKHQVRRLARQGFSLIEVADMIGMKEQRFRNTDVLIDAFNAGNNEFHDAVKIENEVKPCETD